MSAHSANDGLTRNETLVMGALRTAGGPLKAYDILDRLKDDGVRAPMTVYRALDGLTSKGLVQKVETLNAFVPCARPGRHEVQMFLVCDSCGAVREIEIGSIEADLGALAKVTDFTLRTARLEVQGVCSGCAGAPKAG